MKRFNVFKDDLCDELNIPGYDMVTGSKRFPLGFFDRTDKRWDFEIYIDETIPFLRFLFTEVNSWKSGT